MAKPPITAFMSYSKEDEETAKEFRKAFAKCGIRIFSSRKDGKFLQDADVIKEIKKREFFIMLLTQWYDSADHMNRHCGMAIALDKTVIPICVEYSYENEKFTAEHMCKECEGHEPVDCAKELKSEIICPDELIKKTIDCMIEGMGRGRSKENMVFFARHLRQFESFTPRQISRIARTYLKNHRSMDNNTAGSIILGILKRNHAKVSARIKGRLGILPERFDKQYRHLRSKDDKYAVSQGFWTGIDIEVHRAGCSHVPKYLTHGSPKWFFAPTLRMAKKLAEELGEIYERETTECMDCNPGKGRPVRRWFWH